MIIGVPKEVKNRENRVGLTPSGVRSLVNCGHTVKVQKEAGIGSGIRNEEFEKAGARIVPHAADVWDSEMVIKVKEPLPEEFSFLRPQLILYTYLHLAAEKKLTEVLLEKKVTGVAYETIQDANGSLPLLKPMSEVAGRMSIQVGAYYLQSSWDRTSSGKGVLLGGIPGVAPGKVVVLGGGVAGSNAAMVALGMGAEVTILDVNLDRLEFLERTSYGKLTTLMSHIDNIATSVANADLVIGAVLVPAAKAPKLVSEEMVRSMAPGSVIVDIAVDQGGCIETCRPTSHENPTFISHGVVHYCVTNMPGAVARTSTFGLTNVTLKYAIEIANQGVEDACRTYSALKKGMNTYHGKLVQEQVAMAHNLSYSPLEL